MSEHFARFKAVYPRREAWKDAQKAWGQVDADRHVDAILAALAWQRESDQWRRGFIPLPATYLRGERWTDEPPKPLLSAFEQAREERHQRAIAQQIAYHQRRQA